MKIWRDIKSKVLGERPVPGLHYRKGIYQRAPCDLIQASAVTGRLHAAWCNVQNVITLFFYFKGADCREMCAVLWRENVSSVCCEGESCGPVWTTEI